MSNGSIDWFDVPKIVFSAESGCIKLDRPPHWSRRALSVKLHFNKLSAGLVPRLYGLGRRKHFSVPSRQSVAVLFVSFVCICQKERIYLVPGTCSGPCTHFD